MRQALLRLRPPPKLTVSEWADRYRELSAEASAEPGRWRTARAAYQREVMDAISDPAIEVVVAKFSSQVGKTEILLNGVGYHIDRDPAPILVLLPTLTMADAWSAERLSPMLRDSAVLADRIPPARSRDSGNTTLHKSFRGGHITLTGANSPASLSSRPIRILVCDEVDRYPANAGSEGDPLALAMKRTSTFWNRKVVLASSPLLEGSSRIDAAYQRSDQRRYWVPCPHCSEMQTLAWQHVQWSDEDPSTARYHCSGCGAGWTDQERWRAVNDSRAAWRADRPGGKVAGFHLSELYSPWRTLQQTVSDFLEARKTTEGLQVFWNTSLGETWQDRGEAPDHERLIERRETLEQGVVPEGAVVLTAGVDNQSAPARLEVYVWAWGPGFESWLVHQETIDGSPADDETWDNLAEVLDRDWPRAEGGSMRIAKAGVDTGGNYTAAVYVQIRRLRDPRIIPMKGVDGWNKSSPIVGPTFIDVTHNGVKLKKGLRLWTVAVSTYKLDLYRRLWLGRGDGVGYPPGWVHLPEWLDGAAVKQLVAEQLVTIKKRSGFARNEWKQIGPNEALDCAVYARAALAVHGADRYGDRFWSLLRSQLIDGPVQDPGMPATPVPVPVPGSVPSYGQPGRSRVRRSTPYRG